MGPAELVGDERDREDEDEHDELRASEERESQPEQGEDVVSPGRGIDRSRSGEHRPQKCRIGRDLGREERGVDGPRQADREHADEVGGPEPPCHAAGEQEGRNARRAHDPGVRDVHIVEVSRNEAPAEERRDQERVELVVRVRDLASEVRERKAPPGVADRVPLVQQLVGHREPVGHPPGDLGECEGQRDPDAEDEKRRAGERSYRVAPRARLG